jgi:hypothetical protein
MKDIGAAYGADSKKFPGVWHWITLISVYPGEILGFLEVCGEVFPVSFRVYRQDHGSITLASRSRSTTARRQLWDRAIYQGSSGATWVEKIF